MADLEQVTVREQALLDDGASDEGTVLRAEVGQTPTTVGAGERGVLRAQEAIGQPQRQGAAVEGGAVRVAAAQGDFVEPPQAGAAGQRTRRFPFDEPEEPGRRVLGAGALTTDAIVFGCGASELVRHGSSVGCDGSEGPDCWRAIVRSG